jgi:hypothetical protein
MIHFKKIIILVGFIAVVLIITNYASIGAQYDVGSGNDDWWTKYPDQHSGAGNRVNHPSWVLDALGSRPVLIYVHKVCDYCIPQTESVKNVTSEFNDKITFYEIIADGNDVRSEEALQAYDPNGGIMYVPLTVMVSLASNSEGVVEPVWHSTEEITGDPWIKNYVEDALSRFNENSKNWSK